jgi:hypothetical protein
MKKFLSLALALMLALTLTACNGGNTNTPSGGNTNPPATNTPSGNDNTNTPASSTPNSMTEEEVDKSINIEVGASENYVIDSVIMPANRVFVTSTIHGDFGFDYSFDVTAEQLNTAGLNSNEVKLFYVADDRNISEIANAIKANSDGSLTVTINHFSTFVLAETAPQYFPDGFHTFRYEAFGATYVYEGYWKNGLPNGEGTMTRTDGGDYLQTTTGNFVDGLLYGEVTYTDDYQSGSIVTTYIYQADMGRVVAGRYVSVNDPNSSMEISGGGLFGMTPFTWWHNAQSPSTTPDNNGGNAGTSPPDDTTTPSGTYTVVLIGNDDSNYTKTYQVTPGSGQAYPVNQLWKETYRFDGWFIDGDRSKPFDWNFDNITSDLTIHALWTKY